MTISELIEMGYSLADACDMVRAIRRWEESPEGKEEARRFRELERLVLRQNLRASLRRVD